MSGQTVIIGFAIAIGAIVAAGVLSLPFVIAHKTVITRRQLKVMARVLERSEQDLETRSSPKPSVQHKRKAYAFLVASRGKAR